MQPITKLQSFLQSIEDLPALPEVTARVLQASVQEDGSISQISKIIETDISFASRILKIVNSSYYGLRQDITNLKQAVSYLGLESIRNLALMLSLFDVFPAGQKKEYTGLYAKCLCAAATAKIIAEVNRLDEAEDVFLGGMMQYIGAFIFLRYAYDRYVPIVTLSKTFGLDILLAEKQKFGINQFQIGQYIAKKWQLPSFVFDVFQYRNKRDYLGQQVAIGNGYDIKLETVRLGALASEVYFGWNKAINLARFKREFVNINKNEKHLGQDILTAVPHVYENLASMFTLPGQSIKDYDFILRESEEELINQQNHLHRYFLKNDLPELHK